MSQAWPEEKEEEWPQHPPEVISRVASKPETWLDRFALRLATLLVALPWLLVASLLVLPPLIGRMLPPGPVTTIPIEGYYLNYHPTLRRCAKNTVCKDAISYYMGLAADGRCHTVKYPSGWDSSMCAIRLRQIDANDCHAVPDNDDGFCRQMLADLAAPGAIKRRARITLSIQRGEVVDWRPTP